MKIRNQSGEDLVVPGLGGRLVLKGQVVEVDEADVYAYTQQSIWDPVDADAQAAHDAAHEAYLERLDPTPAEPEPEPETKRTTTRKKG